MRHYWQSLSRTRAAGRRLLAVLSMGAVLCAWSFAHADSPHSVTYRNVMVLQANPILLRDIASLDYQYRLYDSESPYLRNNYFGVALRPVISPGFVRIGGAMEFAPASVVRLGLGFEQVNYFGGFDQLQGFSSVDAIYSDSALAAGGDSDANYAASGNIVTGSLQAQNRFGPIIVRDLFELQRVSYNLHTGDDFFYDPVLDLLLPERGFAFTNDADILYISPFGFIVGMRYTITKAFYGTDSDPNGPTHRLGPSLSYVVFQDPGAAFDSATVFVLLNWWIKHRFRTGADVSGGFPFLSVGFSFTGEIL